MRKFIYFNILQIFFKGQASDICKLNIYQNNNFNVFIPCNSVNELPLYLPEKINSIDLNKIKEFVNKTYQMNYQTSENEYKLEFYVDLEGVHLKNITIQKFQIVKDALSINSIKNAEVFPEKLSLKSSLIDIRTTIITETVRIITIKGIVKQNSLIAYGFPSNLIYGLINIVDKIKLHHYQNQIKCKNIQYDFILEKKLHRKVEVVGVRITGDKYEEIIYIINSPLGGDQLLVNKNGEIIPEASTGLYGGAPVTKTYGKLGSPFGFRRDPKNHKVRKHHGGQDIVISLNTPIICVEDGLIVDCGYNKSYGFFVVVHHGNATKNGYSSVYGHLNVIEVLMGQKVRKGQIIGLSGSTGRSTGPHLHFEWIKNQNSQRLNPLIPTSKKHSICKGLIGAFMKPIVELVDKVCAKIIVS